MAAAEAARVPRDGGWPERGALGGSALQRVASPGRRARLPRPGPRRLSRVDRQGTLPERGDGTERAAPRAFPHRSPVIERLVARIPALLALALLALLAWVAVVQTGQSVRLLAGLPLTVVGVLYLLSGRARRRRAP